MKKNGFLVGFLFFINIFLLLSGITCYFLYLKEVKYLKNYYSPKINNGKATILDNNSTIVKYLYNTFSTNEKEDNDTLGKINNKMKLYLAYRSLPNNKIHESNCNLYVEGKNPLYSCKKEGYIPTSFKEEDLKLQLNILFGENNKVELNDIASSIIEYQYIPERGEFVSGKMHGEVYIPFRKDAKLIKAYSKSTNIYLEEEVKYYSVAGNKLKEELVSGKYRYSFRIDNNYNIIFESKDLIK